MDDGSPDKSGEICDYYAGKDPRIIVYHKENGGVSSARNYGIEHAVGEWICFVDSDDTILPTYLENFELDKVEADLYMQGYVRTQKGKVIDRHNFANCKGKESSVYLPTLRKITLSIRHVLSYSKGVLLLIMTLGSIQTPHTEKTIYFLWLTCFYKLRSLFNG